MKWEVNLISKIKYLYDLTPRQTLLLLKKKMSPHQNSIDWSESDLVSDQKQMKGIRFFELLERQEKILSRNKKYKKLNFENKRVVEIGCGPLGGYGPLSIFLGADAFVSAEPEFSNTVFFSDSIKKAYLIPLHADLTSIFGAIFSFDEFYERLRTRLTVQKCYFQDIIYVEKADIILSQSVLEHVFNLNDVVKKINDLSTDRTRSLHLVDFGNHYISDGPFDGLYSTTKQRYLARRPGSINLLRCNDIERLFVENGLSINFARSRVFTDLDCSNVHDSWSSMYENIDLQTQLAIFYS